MKNLLPVFIAFLLTNASKADGGVEFYIVKWRIILSGNVTSTAYTYLAKPLYHPDSIERQSYLRNLLHAEMPFEKHEDSIAYYKGLIEYRFVSCNHLDSLKEKCYLRQLTDLVSIAENSLLKVEIDTLIEHHWGTSIHNELHLSDTSWIKKKPVKVGSADGYLCSFAVHVHESTAITETVLKRLRLIVQETEEINLRIQSTYEETDDEYSSGQLREKLYTRLEEIDRELFETMKKLRGQKVVIIESCTC